MLVSIKHRLVILAMPKCASTSLERALSGRVDLVLRGMPQVKHTPYRKYDRFLRPYLESYTKEPLEVVSLIREPVDWLHSWWRYRGRPGIPDPANSTAGMNFTAFVEAYLDGQRKPADVGRQARFVSTADERLGVDRLFRYERLEVFLDWLGARLNGPVTIGYENRSPHKGSAELPKTLSAELRRELARDFELYEGAAG
ncbi:MAG: gamma-glutamyl kinase [Pseudomonadota bacterium]